jgi:hypothetical protein
MKKRGMDAETRRDFDMSSFAKVPSAVVAVVFSFLEQGDHVALSLAGRHLQVVSWTGAASPVCLNLADTTIPESMPLSFLRKRPQKMVWGGGWDAQWCVAFASSLQHLVLTNYERSRISCHTVALLVRMHTFKQVYSDGARNTLPPFAGYHDPDVAPKVQRRFDRSADDEFWSALLVLPSLTCLMVQDMSVTALGNLALCRNLRHLTLNTERPSTSVSGVHDLALVRGIIARVESLESLCFYGDYEWFEQFPHALAPSQLHEWLLKFPRLQKLTGARLRILPYSPRPDTLPRNASVTFLQDCGVVTAGEAVIYALATFPGLSCLRVCPGGTQEDVVRGYVPPQPLPPTYPNIKVVELRGFKRLSSQPFADYLRELYALPTTDVTEAKFKHASEPTVPVHSNGFQQVYEATCKALDKMPVRFPHLERLMVRNCRVSCPDPWRVLGGGASIRHLELLQCEIIGSLCADGFESVTTLHVRNCTTNIDQLTVPLSAYALLSNFPNLETLLYDAWNDTRHTGSLPQEFYCDDLRTILHATLDTTSAEPDDAVSLSSSTNDRKERLKRSITPHLRHIHATYRTELPDRLNRERIREEYAAALVCSSSRRLTLSWTVADT